MGRKKVTMELIVSRSIRGVTFKKRKASLFKKASELSTLCGIEVCLAVSKGPDDPAPEVWPSVEVMTQLVSQANGRSNAKLDKKMARQVAEMQLQLQQLEEENLDLQALIVSEEALSGSSSVARAASREIAMRLLAMVDGWMKEVQDRMDSISISSSAALGTVHPPQIQPKAGKCVVPTTEQDIAGNSNPSGVASLADVCVVDAMPELFDLPEDMEQFFNGLPAEIAYSTQWLGTDWEWEWEGLDDIAPIL